MKRFCVKCGKETNELVKGLCENCFLDKNKVLEFPEKIKIDLDNRTDKIRVGYHWIENNEENLSEMLGDKLKRIAGQKRLVIVDFKAEFEEQKKKTIPASITFETVLEGVKLKVHQHVDIVLHSTISDASMKLASNYHEAIIQIRFKEKVKEEEVKEKLRQVLMALQVEKKKDELSEAVDVKKVAGGQDLFVGSQKAAKKVSNKVAKKFKADLTYSNKQIGMDRHGKHTFRHTYSIRF